MIIRRNILQITIASVKKIILCISQVICHCESMARLPQSQNPKRVKNSVAILVGQLSPGIHAHRATAQGHVYRNVSSKNDKNKF